ncbi:MAG: 2-amino-4-hydroxy-6-hydroxymethyldihydropteridine diphosphokinase [Acidimicrobiales bacterium]
MTRRAFLGLGSNLGDRLENLQHAIDRIPDVVKVSSIWETAPVGGPEQGPYLNCVVQLDTDRTARQLLAVCREREEEAERVRTERWGPRTLDVDVLWIDDEVVDEYDLVVPHPRMFERAFVLVPLGDLAPDLIPSSFVTPPETEVWKYTVPS